MTACFATYDGWMKKVDAVLMSICGLTSSDLADGPSRDAYDSGESPRSYALQLLEDEGFPLD